MYAALRIVHLTIHTRYVWDLRVAHTTGREDVANLVEQCAAANQNTYVTHMKVKWFH